MDGRVLHFHLSGINNQNFIMRDEETGSWWQQVSGKAIAGPLKGRSLKPVLFDESSFATWKREHPGGRVLRKEAAFAKEYAPADWEKEIAALPVVTRAKPGEPLPPRALIFGLSAGGESRAYPRERLAPQRPINDRLAGVPVLVVLGEDGKTVRAFERSIAGRALEFFQRPAPEPWGLIDAQTASSWDFTGRAVAGPLAGERLPPVRALPDYWFDWKTYHPDTSVYSAGLPAAPR
jgi:hypothetical protein